MSPRLILALALIGALPLSAQQRAKAPNFARLDSLVTSEMRIWHIPGLALGIVRDGQVVLAKGYGFRDVENQLPVTPRTLMAIGSNSKSFTVVLMGMLVDEKKLEWDKPVKSYLPDFKLWDDYATEKMTPRDLVNHRSGLPRHDLLWYGRKFGRKELFDRLRYLEPNASFRDKWQYQNLMFMTAGYLTERITGKSWDDQVRERIFTPLGMTRSNTSVNDTPKSDDFAYPYAWRDSALVKIPFRNLDNVGPAGSINSSVEDMLKYVQLRMDRGTTGGRQLLSEASEYQMQQPQMAIVGGGFFGDSTEIQTYGLGLMVGTYRGHRLVVHGGGIDGFISQMSWLPAERIGLMVLTNQGDNNPVPNMLVAQVYDLLLGLPPIDWIARARREEQEAVAQREKARKEHQAQRKPGTSPSHELAAYAGSFEHPGYGTITVRTAGRDLEVLLDSHEARLTHYHYDVFEVSDPKSVVPFRGLAEFMSNAKGEVDRVALPLEPNVSPILFRRVGHP